ncbi:hypothetical protein KO500_09185 [Cellulophaga baltica]|uniref:DUF6452 family protein n=1 Tax=Cellulophaga TaxID=104264 RepID=UPI001C074D8E|nr:MULTISPECIES: DUF6452 family protein [Cellulophaga]MBU2996608.1 hypothetical protein [Cellulophaga baltica]MDO6768002.1 DUF6452 family protein [Cellulophaga sp. 1_MG-2023]
MDKLKYIVVMVFIFFAFNSCEKDDICVDGDTPLLIIGFYDFDDQDDEEEPSNLVVRSLSSDGVYGDTIANVDTDSIEIPLKITELSTMYSFSISDDDGTNINEDIVTFDYATEEVYISRACGYVVYYNNLIATLTEDDDNWIEQIDVEVTTIENEDDTHVKIYL